ncbi:MAG: Gfo/Idh/MocA family oxidoreductase, partial [Planctomycetota bacterium]
MRAAIVGVGFMGWIHYLAYEASSKATLAGFSSRDPIKRKGDWTMIRGNFGPPGRRIDVSGLHVTEDLQGLLSDDSIDLIDICLPPHLHEDTIEACLAAGKHVLCEKPLALDSRTCDSLARQGRDGKLLVAHILPFMPEFQLLVDAQEDLRWGRPIAGRFKRTISPPTWIPDFYDPTRVGGPLIDLHVHDAHLIRLLFGMPKEVHTVARRQNGLPKQYESVFRFDDSELVVSAGGGVIDSPARPFTHAFEVSFEEATVQFEAVAFNNGKQASVPLTVLKN